MSCSVCYETEDVKTLVNGYPCTTICKKCAYEEMFVHERTKLCCADISECMPQLTKWFPRQSGILHDRLFRQWITTTKEHMFHCPTVDCPFSCMLANDCEMFRLRCPSCHVLSRIESHAEISNRTLLFSMTKLSGVSYWSEDSGGITQCTGCKRFISKSYGCSTMMCICGTAVYADVSINNDNGSLSKRDRYIAEEAGLLPPSKRMRG